MDTLTLSLSIYLIGALLSILVLRLLYKKGFLKGLITTDTSRSEPDETVAVILILLWPIPVLAGVAYPIGWLLSKTYDAVMHFIFK